MATGDPRSVVRAFYAAFDGRPYEVGVASFLTEDVVWHVAGDNPLAGTFRGADAVLAAMRAFGEASDHTLRLDTMTLLADGHHVVAVHDAHATAGGLAYRAHEVDVFHLRDDRIEAFWSFSEDQDATDRLWTPEPGHAAGEHDVAAHWEAAADAWIAWTSRPDHDAFWAYREGFRAFLPPPGTATLEVGCGEGRIARELTDLGHDVTAVDLSPTLIRAARDEHSAHHHVRADAEHLPFAAATFDRVVAYNMLMDVADMPAAVAEIGRVLHPDGVATLSIVHPFVDRLRPAATGGDVRLDGDYFAREHFTVTEERGGLAMPFAGWSHPLQDYVAAVRDAGLAIVDLAEPRPDRPRAAHRDRVPLFLWATLKARP